MGTQNKLRLILILSCLGFPKTSNCQVSMVPSEIIQAVFQISPDGGKTFGACVAVSIDGLNYVVTAKHVLRPLMGQKEITFYINNKAKWDLFKGKLLLHENTKIDIAVVQLEQKDLVPQFDIGSKNYFASQECFFLGYPYGKKTDDPNGAFNSGFPVPFIKKGIISSFTFENELTPIAEIFVDATNNSGFSGGPLIVKNQTGNDNKFNMRVIGIVSGYISENRRVTLKFGEIVSVPENTGIMYAVPMNYALDIINQSLKK